MICPGFSSAPKLRLYASINSSFATNKWPCDSYSNKYTQYHPDRINCHWDWQICIDQLAIRICTAAFQVHLKFDEMSAKAAALPWLSKLYFSGKCDWEICGAGSVLTWLKTYAGDSPVHLNFDHIPPNTAVLLRMRKVVSWILTQQLNIAPTDYVAKWDWQIRSATSIVKRGMADPDNSLVYLRVVRLCFFNSFDFEMGTSPHVSRAPHICNLQMIWSPLQHHAQSLTYAIHREIDPSGTCYVANELSSSHIGHY